MTTDRLSHQPQGQRRLAVLIVTVCLAAFAWLVAVYLTLVEVAPAYAVMAFAVALVASLGACIQAVLAQLAELRREVQALQQDYWSAVANAAAVEASGSVVKFQRRQ